MAAQFWKNDVVGASGQSRMRIGRDQSCEQHVSPVAVYQQIANQQSHRGHEDGKSRDAACDQPFEIVVVRMRATARVVVRFSQWTEFRVGADRAVVSHSETEDRILCRNR